MITIVKDNEVRTVSKGLYNELYKDMGFTPVEMEIKADKVVVDEEDIISDEEVQELNEDEVLDVKFDGELEIENKDEVKDEVKDEQPKRHNR